MPKPSIYQALADHLTVQPPDVRQVTLSLTEIEALMGRPLCASARSSNFWPNGATKTHTRTLRRAGWQVLRPASSRYGPRVTFERV